MRVTYRTDDEATERSVSCDAYEEFEGELVLYDAADEVVASVPRERVVSVVGESY